MNDSLKSAIIFLSGLGVGVGAGYIVFKSYYENKADSQIRECQLMYEQKEREFKEITTGSSIEDTSIKPDAPKGLEGSTTSIDNKDAVKPAETDYTTFFKGKEDKDDTVIKKTEKDLEEDVKKAEEFEHIDPSETESPEDDTEMSDIEDDYAQEDYEMYLVNEEHKKAVAEGRAPYEIPEGAFGTVPGYDTMDLYYFQIDNVLCDENHEEVDMPELFVGDLLETDWIHDGRPNICIRSDTEMIDVEVHKNTVDKFYSE